MKALPNPVSAYIASIAIPPPSAARPISFFDPPTTKLASKAAEFIHALLPAWGENHCYRTYAFGLAIADSAGWTSSPAAQEYGWDKELWFLTAILHDIGWDEVENFKTKLSFEIFGGIKAREVLLAWGANPDVADEVCEAIIRHTDGMSTSGGTRIMGALCQMGALHDLLGVSTPSLIHHSENTAICTRWPRLGLALNTASFLERELSDKPGCLVAKNGAEHVIQAMKQPVHAFEGLEGERVEDEGWKARRKDVVF